MTTYNKNNRVPSYALGVPEQEAYGGVPTDEAYRSGLDNGMYQFEKDRLADEQALRDELRKNIISVLSKEDKSLLLNNGFDVNISKSTVRNDFIHNDLQNKVFNVPKRINFNDVYYANTDEYGNKINQGINDIEGGYSNRVNDRGGITNFGVTQNTLTEYNNWKHHLRTRYDFPKNVRDLTEQQAKQIIDERYYQAYNISAIQNLMIAKNMLDAEVNQGTDAGKLLADSVNEYLNSNFPRNIVISSSLADTINNLSDEDIININDIFGNKRMEKYFRIVDNNHTDINNLKSRYNRTRNYYSNPTRFDQLFKLKLDEYLNNKYYEYYNGR